MSKHDNNDIISIIKSPTLEMFEKIALVNVNKDKIDNLPVIVKQLKTDNDYIQSPVVHVFDRITDSILSTANYNI